MASPNDATPFDGLDLSKIPDAPKLKGIYDSVADEKPEQAAKVLSLAAQTGQHPAFVAANLPQAQQAVDTPHPDLFAEIEKNHPAATKFLSDPANMAVAQGDLPNVAQHSQLVENAKREMGFLDAVKSGLEGSSAGLASQIAFGTPAAEPMPPSLKLGVGKQIGGLVGDFVPMAVGSTLGGVAGAAAGFEAGSVAGPLGEAVGTAGGAVLGAGAGAMALPAALKTMLSEHIQKGNLTGVQDALQRTYDILKESGKQGFIGALTAGTGGAGKLAGLGPIATLAAENAAMTVGGDAVEGKMPKPGELGQQFIENGIVIGAMHGAGAAGDHVMQKWAESKRVEADQNFYKAMGQTAGASKLMKLMPEAHQDLIRRLTDGSPVTDVYVPVQAWDSHFQTSGFDPKDAAQRIGVGTAYPEAKLTGGDVKVPLDVWISKLVGTPHYDKLAGDVKFSADGMTLNQLNEQDTKAREDIEKAQTALQPQIEKDIKASAQEQGIFADLHKQLQASGVLKGSKQYEAKLKDAATLAARHYAVESQLRNMEPQALYDQVKNKITQGLTSDVIYPKLSAHEQQTEPSGPVGESAGRSSLAESVRQGAERLDGLPASSPGPSPEVREAARIYARSVGLPVREQTGYVAAEPGRGRRIAEAFAALKHDPSDPEVKAAYDALIRETTAQYHVLKEMGLKIESIKAGQENPYKNSAAMIADVRSGHMWFFPTTEGFGSDARFNDHPLFADTAEKLDDGTKLKANDLFRVVHDFFGHVKEGVTFGANGEENAWQSHVRMYSALAARAMTTETRGQNSWVNFHPDSEANRTKPGSVYADQKAAIMPEWVSSEGLAPEKFEAADAMKQTAGETLGEFNPAKKAIKFFKSADVTTIPHELAHAWIEDAFQFVKTGTPDEDYLRHWQAAKDWLKVGDDQDKLTKDQHEKFAQGFEKYIMEGKAPSADLRPIFFRMAQWMTQVYRDLKNSIRGGSVKATDLTDSARGFMDRLLATNDEIQSAANDSGYNPGDIHGMEGIEPDQQKRVRTLQERAHEQAFEQLVREKMQGISEGNREEYAKERERVTAQHFNEVANEPVFRAYSLFNPEGTDERINQPDIWKECHGYLNGKLDHENTAKFDTIAEMSGFSDAKEMAQKLLLTERAPAFEKALNDKVNANMEQFSNLKDPQEIRDAATAAVHNDDSTQLLALEQKILGEMTAKKEMAGEVSRRNAVSAREDAASAKKNAADILAGKSVKEASAFRPYITAERKAAQRVTAAIADGDMAAAAQAKGEQMLNHALYAEAFRNSKLVAKLSKVVDKYAGRGNDLMGMPFGFMQQIDGLLESTGLSDPRPSDISTMVKIAQAMKDKNGDPSEIANATGLIIGADGKWRKERLPEFAARVNENYYAMQLPDSMTDPVHRQTFPQGMTLGDFRDLTDTMKTIGSIGRTFEHFLDSFHKGDLKTNAAALRAKIEAEIGTPYGNNPQFGELDQSKLQKAVEWIKGRPDGMIQDKVNLLTLCEYLDRMDPNGPAKNNIYRPLERAWNDEAEIRADKSKELDDLRKKYYTPKELKKFGDTFARWKIQTPDGVKDVKLTRENALILLMNRGSETNLDRLTRGFNVSEEQIKAITDGLSNKDHQFAQGVLDYVNKFWPQAKALEMDVNGVEPSKVASRPIESAHGTFAGGYFPLAYDFTKSADAYKNAIQRNALYKQFTTTAAHTEQGAMKSRVESLARPVRLDFSGLYNHLDDVIHDITHRRAVIDVARFLNQPDAKSAIINAIGQDGYRKIGEDLKAVASSQTEFLTPGEQTVRWFRFATTFATLGYRFAIAPRRLSEDSVNAIREVGFRNLSGAVGDTLKDPTTIRQFVQDSSPMMRDRAINREADFVQMQKQWKGKDSAVKRFAFLQDTLADQALSYPVWKATYDSALSKYGHDQATTLADEAIVKTFGSGRELDKVGAQRGSELNRMMAMYYSWHSMMFNRAWLQGKIAGLEYNEGNYGKALAIVASTAATTWLIPSALNSLWSETLRNNQGGSDDDRKKRVIGNFVDAPFAYFPMGRNIAGAAIPLLLGERNRGYHLSPLEDAAENVINAAGEAGNIGLSKLGLVDEKDHPRFAEDSTRAMSVIVGMPQQLSTWTFNMIDFLNHEGEANWRDLLTRRTQR